MEQDRTIFIYSGNSTATRVSKAFSSVKFPCVSMCVCLGELDVDVFLLLLENKIV